MAEPVYKLKLSLTAQEISDLRLALVTEEQQTRGDGFDPLYHASMTTVYDKVAAAASQYAL